VLAVSLRDRRVPSDVAELIRRARRIGPIAALKLVPAVSGLLAKLTHRSTLALRMKGQRAPFRFRPGTSDKEVIEHIFIAGEYDWLPRHTPKTILDLGANIGATARYFLANIAGSRVIALEPDEGNHELLAANLAPFGDRAEAQHAAVWSRDTSIKVVRGEFLDGSEWTYQAKEHPDDSLPSVAAKSVPTIMEEAGLDTVDMLKIDIEGGELELFGSGSPEWLRRVKNISIELHGHDCETAFFRAMEPYDYSVERRGELTICLGIQPK
jgi:FkbM family methyltransferase